MSNPTDLGVHASRFEALRESPPDRAATRQGEVSWCQTKDLSDNGPQFISKDFKAFISFCQMTHVRTSPYYPQSSGKFERWHRSMKSE